MKSEKKESLKEKILDRYFDDNDEGFETVTETIDIKDNFSYETASVVNEISAAVEPTIISSETVIHGNLNAKGDLEISGQVLGDIVAEGLVKVSGGSITGNIKAEKILIKNSIINGNLDCHEMIDIIENSEINGNITGEDVVIDCQCRGNIVAMNHLRLLERAIIHGDIQTKVIKIEEGAVVEGNFKMTL